LGEEGPTNSSGGGGKGSRALVSELLASARAATERYQQQQQKDQSLACKGEVPAATGAPLRPNELELSKGGAGTAAAAAIDGKRGMGGMVPLTPPGVDGGGLQELRDRVAAFQIRLA